MSTFLSDNFNYSLLPIRMGKCFLLWKLMNLVTSITFLTNWVHLSPVTTRTFTETFVPSNLSVKLQFWEQPDLVKLRALHITPAMGRWQ